MDKIVEHYGVVLSECTIARITKGLARKIFETAPPPQGWPTQAGTSRAIILETDGGRVPIVAIDAVQSYKRTLLSICWPCGSIVQTVSGTAIGGEFAAVKIRTPPHQFESHTQAEAKTSNISEI